MYRALVDRDASFDGSFFVGIRTTGIYCRPGCGARKPKPENVEYFRSAEDAERRGYRPCLRCRPLESALATPAWAKRLLALAESAPRITSSDLRANGIDPARASRYCRRRFGMSFQAWMRSRQLAGAFEKDRAGASVARVALESGFESESGFRDAFARLFGAPPTRAGRRPRRPARRLDRGPIGPMLAAASDEASRCSEFADRRALKSQIATLRRHFPGRRPVPTTTSTSSRPSSTSLRSAAGGVRRELARKGTPFQEAVWERLAGIPSAGRAPTPTSRARSGVRPRPRGRARERRQPPRDPGPLSPRDRFRRIRNGYGGGVWRKEWLLAHEREHAGALRRLPSRAQRPPAVLRGGSR